MTTSRERQQAVDDAQRTCEREGTPTSFALAYRRICFDRGIDPDEAPQKTFAPSISGSPKEADALVRCPECKALFKHSDLLAANAGDDDDDAPDALSRINADLADLRMMRLPNGAAASHQRGREERAAAWARDRCVREAAPTRFARYYEERLQKIS